MSATKKIRVDRTFSTDNDTEDKGVASLVEKARQLNTSRTINGVGFNGTANISFGTDSVSEGSTNLYYTNTRARGAISVSGSLSYNSSTGVISYTTPSTSSISEGTNLYYTDARARAAVSAGTGISYNSTTGVITNTITQYTDALARAAVSFTAGSGAYNSTTGVFTIPTNTNQLTNGAGFITGYTETDTLATVTGRGATTSTAVSFTNSTASTSKITGAVVVTGGVGISGALYVGGEVTAYASDVALKTNVVAIDNALSKVEAIRGVSYDWNEAGQALGLGTAKQIGVIAQEVEAVAPELVVQSAHEGYKTVKYDKLTALLIEAVKDLSAKVKTLEAQLGKSL